MSLPLLTATGLLAACVLDRCLGEPRRWHPLLGFGRLAAGVESILNRAGRADTESYPLAQRLKGLLALLLLTGPLTALAFWIQWRLLSSGLGAMLVYGVVASFVLYWALGWRSLVQHLNEIEAALQGGTIDEARAQVGRVVSRDCESLQWPDLRRAAIESGLENTCDAIVGPLFWFLVAGIPGAVLYRLSNTLDALWGYRTARHRHFGWAAARWDDLLNLLPARLTALAFALSAPLVTGSWRSVPSALNAWRTQAGACASPNAGPVMCAGAGALDVRLGGPTSYHGAAAEKPWMGSEREPDQRDLRRALVLINHSVLLLLVPTLLVLLILSGGGHG
ncbi:adenosylcobinamide-phosphate synthase CbiB [Marinimicrobium sp. C2-29]|uniref:adenosylcobinamide-phosphate synthase CbiB n=1 Tax=Marinimicrobium sp. C2-29 TaxID=3139825 RepID=UPI00313A3630